MRGDVDCGRRTPAQVGSYALMHGTGFELMDMLLCCKFAEGDSRILQMKLARDRLKKVHVPPKFKKKKSAKN